MSNDKMATDSMRRPDLKENTALTARAKSHSPERIDYVNYPAEPAPHSDFWSKPAEHLPSLRDTPKLKAKPGVDGFLVDDKSLYGIVPNSSDNKLPTTGLPTRRSISVPSLDKESQQPALQRSDSDISRLANNLDNLTIEKRNTPSPEAPMGKIKALNTINTRFTRFATNNEHMKRSPSRNPSWTATAVSPKAKIEESLIKIMQFVNSVEEISTNTDTFREKTFKLFLDANKEIVRTWNNIHNEAFKGRPYPAVLSEATHGMDAIVQKWDQKTIDEWIVGQSMNLVALDLTFGKEWERLTGNDLGVAEYAKKQGAKEKSALEKSVESFEEMEFIPPKAAMEKNNAKGGENNGSRPEPTIGSPGKSSNATPSIEDLQPRNRSKSFQFPTTKSAVLPSVEEQPDTPPAITNSPQPIIDEDARIHERLDNIERTLKQLPIQSINEAIEMQKLLLPAIYDGIFGEWDKVDPDQNSDRRAQAKRTGLLMLAKYMQEWKEGWKEGYGQKIDGLDCAVRGKKSDSSASLLTTCTRIETSLSSLTTLTTDLATTQNTTPPPLIATSETTELESENSSLHQELSKLQALLTLATQHNAQETLRLENEKLKKEVGGLKKSLDAVLFTLAEKEGKEGDKDWVEEAWEEVYEGFWPQGYSTKVKAEGNGYRKILVPREEGDVETPGDTPETNELLEKVGEVGNQAGRGGGGGTGTGSCAVM